VNLEDVAKKAGELLKEYKGRLKSVQEKSSVSDVVSEADYESQKLIERLLRESFPDYDVVGEENFSKSNSRKIFLVDPLDGSLNYVHGFPFYSVSIARIVDGEIVEGVVHLPETRETFHAIKGEGSHLNGERLTCGDAEFERSLIVTGWPYDHEGTLWTYEAIRSVNEKVQEIRILGSCAAELSYLAAGRIDGYFEIGLGPWDLAAGYLIATEAGAVVTSISTDDFDLYKGEVVAGKPSVHEKLLKVVRSVKL
jgi:myo-inositol-1(or 4)-monophosphatase